MGSTASCGDSSRRARRASRNTSLSACRSGRQHARPATATGDCARTRTLVSLGPPPGRSSRARPTSTGPVLSRTLSPTRQFLPSPHPPPNGPKDAAKSGHFGSWAPTHNPRVGGSVSTGTSVHHQVEPHTSSGIQSPRATRCGQTPHLSSSRLRSLSPAARSTRLRASQAHRTASPGLNVTARRVATRSSWRACLVRRGRARSRHSWTMRGAPSPAGRGSAEHSGDRVGSRG